MAFDDALELRPVAPGVSLPPPVTLAEVKESKHEQALAPILGLAAAAAPVAPVMLLPAGLFSSFGKKGTTLWSGVTFGPSLDGAPVKPSLGPKAFATYLLPAPAGIVPAELYQIRPSWAAEALPFKMPAQESLGIKASSVRERVFESERAERAIIHAVLKDWSFSNQQQDLSKFTTEQIAAMAAFLKATATTQPRSVAALNVLNAELQLRPNLALPISDNPMRIPSPTDGSLVIVPAVSVGNQPAVPQITSGGFNPSAVRPLTLLAMASLAAAQFLRKELITERADP